MIDFLSQWFRRNFSDRQLIILLLLLTAVFTTILLFGKILGPVLAAVVIAYLMDWPVEQLRRFKINRMVAVAAVYLVFIALLLFIIVVLMPLLSRQVTQLVSSLPEILRTGQQVLAQLPEAYPALVSVEQVNELADNISQSMHGFAKQMLSSGLGAIPGVITMLIYLVLVPLLVFFMLKDKQQIFDWFCEFLPKNRKLSNQVWREVDAQLGNYVRGKFWEMLIVGGVTYVAFILLDVPYAALLGAMVGLSVLVPFIGATVVTIPVAAVGFYYFGWGQAFGMMMLAYGIIQVLDGNVLVPLLFSEVVNLHPVAIIVAVLFFGGIWGFWGVFFAIPLATLVKAVISAWPEPIELEEQKI